MLKPFPTTREACRRLDARSAAEGLKKCWGGCRWTDQDGQQWGFCSVEQVASDLVRITHQFEIDLRPETEVETLVHVKKATAFVSGLGFDLFICPRCQKKCRYLLWAAEWTCGACTKLPYRSQAIGSVASRWEKLRWLEREVERGRPPRVWQRTFDRKVAELKALKKVLRGSTRLAPNHLFQIRLTPEWS